MIYEELLNALNKSTEIGDGEYIVIHSDLRIEMKELLYKLMEEEMDFFKDIEELKVKHKNEFIMTITNKENEEGEFVTGKENTSLYVKYKETDVETIIEL